MLDYEYPEEAKHGVIEVEASDGLLMVTQYDFPWRDDLFDKWDFYDVSQSLEFIRHGYKVVVPYMETPWCIHDDGFVNLKNYYEERGQHKRYCEINRIVQGCTGIRRTTGQHPGGIIDLPVVVEI